jgi:DNA-3-methyladenine glycosylase II
MQTLVIHPKPPYDFRRMLDRFRSNPHFLYDIRPNAMIRTIRVEGNIYLATVTSKGLVDTPELEVVIDGNKPDNGGKLESYIQKMLAAELELGTYYAHLNRIDELAPLAERFYGLRILLEPDPFECLVNTVIGQQLNLSFAAALRRRLVEKAGRPVRIGEGEYYVFPSPEEIARLSYEDLMDLQYSRRKAEYVIDFARSVADGRIDLDAISREDNETILAKLLQVRGFGRWTIECFLMFGLGRTDILPAADIGLRNAVKRWYKMQEQPTEKTVREIGEAWSPWSSYITFYLWESLNQPMNRIIEN